MGTDIDITSGTSRPLAVFDKPLNKITTALAIGNKLRQQQFVGTWSMSHHAGSVHTALAVRTEQFPYFLEADAACIPLFWANAEKLDRPVAADMITALYSAVGVKAGEESAGMLAGSVDMIESDAIGCASGLWRPLNVTPASLALACRKLISTSVFPPKPAELRAACEEAGRNLLFAYQAAEALRGQVCKADAILLEFDYEEWKRAYESPRSWPVLARMLELHECVGDGSIEWHDDEENQHPFKLLVMREQAKLAIEQAPQPKKIAAARKRSERKRSPKPKPKSEGEQRC